MFGIAQRYDMTVTELKKLNNLRSDHVTSGTKLLVHSSSDRRSLVSDMSTRLAEAACSQAVAAGTRARRMAVTCNITPGNDAAG